MLFLSFSRFFLWTFFILSACKPAHKEQESETNISKDKALFNNLVENHWTSIFPDGNRNAGGPQFFQYIYQNLAINHDEFQRYNRFYCGVSGSIIDPERYTSFDVVKVKDQNGSCVIGQYHRCCWPCSCDVMKHARAELATIQLPKDPSGEKQDYWLLTIGDPCHRCDEMPCEDIPPEVSAFECKDGITQNGLRLHEGQLTTGSNGRLVVAVLHGAKLASETSNQVSNDLMSVCQERIDASPEQLQRLGGMGNIFVALSLVNTNEEFSNSSTDLCQ